MSSIDTVMCVTYFFLSSNLIVPVLDAEDQTEGLTQARPALCH